MSEEEPESTFRDNAETGALVARVGSAEEEASRDAARELARASVAPEHSLLLTPQALEARLRQAPPARLELPDGVELTGASLAAFLESAHFPFGQYRVGEQRFFATPSLQLTPAMLEALARSGRGERLVGRELLVWQPVSFRVAAGTAADARDARPFVGPSSARAYLWLGPPLPGGPLVLRDANGAEIRVLVPDEAFERSGDPAIQSDESARSDRSDGSVRSPERPNARTPQHRTPNTERLNERTPELPPLHPALAQAEEALRRGDERGVVEQCLREVMRSPGVNGRVLAGAGRLWQALGRADVARAAFTMALERGSAEGALGLSRLAEALGEGLEAAARPLDAAIARNLRTAELHARYAELLGRLSSGWNGGPLVEWHRRQAKALESGMRDEE